MVSRLRGALRVIGGQALRAPKRSPRSRSSASCQGVGSVGGSPHPVAISHPVFSDRRQYSVLGVGGPWYGAISTKL